MIVSSFVIEYSLTGEIRDLDGIEGDKMVGWGLSRFKTRSGGGGHVAVTDEPLPILGLFGLFIKKELTLEEGAFAYVASKGIGCVGTRAPGLLSEIGGEVAEFVQYCRDTFLQIC